MVDVYRRLQKAKIAWNYINVFKETEGKDT
jgi:hypothetical protein